MKRKSPTSGKRQVKDFVQGETNKARLKDKIQTPSCYKSTQITEQLAFEFDMPNCSNAPHPSTSRASSETKPNT